MVPPGLKWVSLNGTSMQSVRRNSAVVPEEVFVMCYCGSG